MIREDGSASRVSNNARPRDPGGGTGSSVPRRRIVIHDVIVSVEQPREEPTLVSHTSSTEQTGQALAENTPLQGCSHDVVGLYAHKGTMGNTDGRVPRKLIKSQYEGGVLTPPPPPPGAAGGHPPAMFPEASTLPIDETQLVSWQVIVVWVDVTPAGDSSEQESPCDSQNRRRPMDMNNSLNNLVYNATLRGPVGPQEEEPLALLVLEHANPVGWHAVVQKRFLGPAGPKVKEPLALWVLIHANHAGQRTDIHRATGFWEPELNPTINRNLDSRPMVGTTYLERPAPAVYLDSRPTEGKVRSKRLEWKPMKISAINRNPDSQPMVGTTYLERPAPAVYLDSWPMEEKIRSKNLEWKPMKISAINCKFDSQPMVGTTYLERPAPRFTLAVGLWKRRLRARI